MAKKKGTELKIKLLKQKQSYSENQRRTKFFIMLDVIAIVGFLIALISFYRGLHTNGLLALLIPGIVLIFYIIVNYFKKR